MINLERLVRPNIWSLSPYSSARDEFTAKEGTFLDANENPFGTLNRYPDPYQNELKGKLSKLKKVDAKNIFIGNGSDEVIDLALRIFCEPGKDQALTFSPTYGMYDVSTGINNIELIKLPLNDEFQIETKLIEPYLNKEELKLIFICSPNNPTANILNKEDIAQVLKQFNGIVVVDEAYIDFSDTASWVTFLDEYPNLIVSQTFSKAWGLAAARVGVAYASEAIITLFNKVKPPYNVSELNQKAAIDAIENQAIFDQNKQQILLEKNKLRQSLQSIPLVKKIYPSEANFLLVEVLDANKIYQALVKEQVIVRNRHALVENCLRLTIGTPEENQRLMTVLKSISL